MDTVGQTPEIDLLLRGKRRAAPTSSPDGVTDAKLPSPRPFRHVGGGAIVQACQRTESGNDRGKHDRQYQDTFNCNNSFCIAFNTSVGTGGPAASDDPRLAALGGILERADTLLFTGQHATWALTAGGRQSRMRWPRR